MKKVLKKLTASLVSGLMLCSSTYAVMGSADASRMPMKYAETQIDKYSLPVPQTADIDGKITLLMKMYNS